MILSLCTDFSERATCEFILIPLSIDSRSTGTINDYWVIGLWKRVEHEVTDHRLHVDDFVASPQVEGGIERGDLGHEVILQGI